MMGDPKITALRKEQALQSEVAEKFWEKCLKQDEINIEPNGYKHIEKRAPNWLVLGAKVMAHKLSSTVGKYLTIINSRKSK